MPSKWPEVESPISAREAFSRSDPQATLSQAAVLLMLGSHARGDEETFAARAQALAPTGVAEFWPQEDLALLGWPAMPKGARAGRIDVQRLRNGLAQRFGDWIHPEGRAASAVGAGTAAALPVLGPLALDQATPDAPAQLLEVCLNHSEELVRVAAASSYFEMSTESDRLTGILADGCKSEDDLVRAVAATALWHVSPDHVVLNSLKSARAQGFAAGAGDTTLLVHGTWSPRSFPPNPPNWWQPGGDFHQYILGNVRSDLYSQADYFYWSGDYSDAARAQGATDLATWVTAHHEDGLDLITHSHGGNVAMLGTHSGLQIGELVMLSCPVHIPKYAPDFTKIAKAAVSIRVHLDLVILADRGGQKFKLPQIQENVLPVWFNHQATHEPDVWNKYNVKSMM